MKHFIDSLRDEVHIIKRLPKRLNRKVANQLLEMSPVSWSTEKYYLEQVGFHYYVASCFARSSLFGRKKAATLFGHSYRWMPYLRLYLFALS